jgi:hypothetical protein
MNDYDGGGYLSQPKVSRELLAQRLVTSDLTY